MDDLEKELFAPFGITEDFFISPDGTEMSGSPKSNLIQKHLGNVLFKVYLMRSFALRIKREATELNEMIGDTIGPEAGHLAASARAVFTHALEIGITTETTAKQFDSKEGRAWRPARKPRGQGLPSRAVRAIEVGSTVSIKESVRADYAGIIEDDELDGLTVVAETGSKVWCKTVRNDRVHLPKKDLVVV